MVKPELTVEIDFDAASKAWLANKIRLRNGCYRYKPETETIPYTLRSYTNKANLEIDI